MILDPKIKVKKIFDCFSDFEEVKKYYGKKVYCADFIENFSNLERYTNKFDFKMFFQQECKPFLVGGQQYRYILPAEFVQQEKQYRAYNIDEWFEKFHLNDGIYLRPKNHRSLEFNVIYNGYSVDTSSNEIKLYLGPGIYTLAELFQSYERFYNGRWYPFGVELEQ